MFELPGVNCIKIEAYLQNRVPRDCHIIFLFQKLRTSSWQLNHSENSIKHQTEALTTSEAVGHKCSSKYVFKNFAILTGTHLCRSLFLIKLQAWRPETLLKRDSKAWNFVEKKLRHSCFRVKFAKFFKTPFLLNASGGCFWLCQWRKTSVNRLYF